jgi:hypothetical protein
MWNTINGQRSPATKLGATIARPKPEIEAHETGEPNV